MKYLMAPFAALAFLAAAATVHAAPFELKTVAADAKWVIHVDVDAIRDSELVKKAFSELPMLKDADKHLDKAKADIGIDLRTDLHGITVYGPDSDKKHVVVIVYSAADKKLLLEKAEKATDHKVTKYGDYEIHSWTAKHHGKSEPGAGAFYKDDVMVFAADPKGVEGAIDVLDGKTPGITGRRSPLGGRTPKGTTVLMRAYDIPDDAHCPMLKEVKSFRVAMGENEGQSFYRARGVMKSSDAAEQIKTIADGFKAMADLHFSGHDDVLKLIDAGKVTVRNDTVNVTWSASVDDIWPVVEKMSKKAEEHMKKMKEMHEKMKEKAKEKDKSK